ncbi:MAG: nucleotidyltransferase domain-containing protein [Desulfobacterales bacterium]
MNSPVKNICQEENIIGTIFQHCPDVQAIYLFGTYGTGDQWPDSDADVALLLDVQAAKQADFFLFSDLHSDLEELLEGKTDILNLRKISTVFQKEVIMANRRIYCADLYAAEEFEMLTLSFYQKLNEERKAILESFEETGKAYAV